MTGNDSSDGVKLLNTSVKLKASVGESVLLRLRHRSSAWVAGPCGLAAIIVVELLIKAMCSLGMFVVVTAIMGNLLERLRLRTKLKM